MSRLRKGEKCPVHGSYYCCGREQTTRHKRKNEFVRGIKRIDDPSNPRGYREIRSKAEMERLLKLKVKEQHNLCGICGEPFTDFRDIAPDHILPRGMGGAYRDDHPDNIRAAHSTCNREKGSRRDYRCADGKGLVEAGGDPAQPQPAAADPDL